MVALGACTSLLALVALHLLALVDRARAVPDLYVGSTSVLRINQYNLASKTSSPNLPLILEFYLPRCGHCRVLESTWLQLAERTEGHVQVGATNCEDPLNELCSRYQIQRFPHIRIFLRNDAGQSYFLDYPEGQGRSLDELLDWVVKKLPSAVLEVAETKKAERMVRLEEFLQRDPHKPHLLLVKKKGRLVSMPAKTLSIKFKGSLVMGVLDGAVDGEAVRRRFGLEQPLAKDADTLLVLRDGQAETYKGQLRFTELTSFLRELAGEKSVTGATTDRRTEL